jgi:hypothetical protein
MVEIGDRIRLSSTKGPTREGGDRLARAVALVVGRGDDGGPCAGNAHRPHGGRRRATEARQEESRGQERGRREQKDCPQERDSEERDEED